MHYMHHMYFATLRKGDAKISFKLHVRIWHKFMDNISVRVSSDLPRSGFRDDA